MTAREFGTHQYSFPKSERLSSQKAVKELFSQGTTFFIFPYKVFYRFSGSENIHHQILISVPRKVFKKAVCRNRIKRRVREAYRLNKNIIYQNNAIPSHSEGLHVAIIYVAKDILDYHTIESKLILALLRLKEVLTEK